MSVARRTSAGIRASVLSFVREPFTLVLLLVLPTVSIQIYGVSLGQLLEIGMFDVAGSLVTTGRITGAVFATGALAGVLGLFQMISARNADRRLALGGMRGVELVASRFATVIVVSTLVGGVATATLVALVGASVSAVPAAFLGLTLAAVVYGLLGILVGTVLPRELEGSLVLVILADMDNIFASGLFGIDESVTRFAPLTHPHDVVTAAVTEGRLATEPLLPAAGHIGIFAVLALVAYTAAVVSGGEP